MWSRIKNFFIRNKRIEEIDETVEYIVEKIFDPETNSLYFIEMTCVCGWTVAYFPDGEEEFWCEHCDRHCNEGMPTCNFCVNLYSAKEHHED
jgi:hypothetical protein